MLIGILLAAGMGVVLGLLGGGGSILTLPILIYALGVGTKEAIATSLLVVAVTSAVGAMQHARAGNVVWRTGLVFGGFAMIGAYGGGRVAALLSGTVLLMLFSGLMLITGAAMLRTPKTTSEPGGFVLWKVVLEGLVVGGVTGLVGAGGGFLVVPALVLFGGMEMRKAIGTSLFVIALKSLAGLAGHLSHVSIDLRLAAMVSVAAVIGTLIGARVGQRIEAAKLRRGFAWFVLLMGGYIVHRELPEAVLHTVFVQRWPFWIGGAAIAGFVLLFLLAAKRPLGVSTGFEDACDAVTNPASARSWRLPFLAGIVIGGAVAAMLAGGFSFTTDMGMFDTLLSASLPVKAAVLTAGGVLIGFGTRLAGGCTSGHGIVGMAQLAPSSLISTAAFMGAGFVVTNLLLRVVAPIFGGG